MAKPGSSSFSLPAQGGRAGPSRPVQQVLFHRPTWPGLLRQLKSRSVKSQVGLSHPESQRQGARKKKMVLFLALALFTNVVPDLLTTVGQFRKANDLP